MDLDIHSVIHSLRKILFIVFQVREPELDATYQALRWPKMDRVERKGSIPCNILTEQVLKIIPYGYRVVFLPIVAVIHHLHTWKPHLSRGEARLSLYGYGRSWAMPLSGATTYFAIMFLLPVLTTQSHDVTRPCPCIWVAQL